MAQIAEQYLRKGSKVYVEGQLETRKWQDQAGNDRYTTEVVLRNFRGELTLLDGRSETNNSNFSETASIDDESSDKVLTNDIDDEIPF